ncbi:ashwin-like isoform X2 [Daphnia pulicaria]|uniref:ashwin-like isoform X2 n=1 Tax=Daphnia pulicaria TaxID=35523 RepID=UPI001EEB24F9|nr:ashwin-like isoform X2 [Daphnia pulicaria]
MSASDHENTWKLLHPELLSQEELLCILRERNVKLDEETSQNKAQLVELFKRVAMPQSQRSCFQDKTSKMEVDQPSSPVKLNSLSRGYQLKQSSGSTTSSTSHSNITSQLNKVKLKRNASEMSKCTSTDGASPTKKREKITWP